MSNPEIQHHTSVTPFLGGNRFATFTLPDTQIPAAGLSAGYVVGIDPDGVPQNTLDVSDTEDAVAILAHDVADGADVTAVFCVGGDVRADSLSFPTGQTLDGNRSATALTHRETLRRVGIFCKDRNALLSAYDVGTAT
jgi:hypothetical protein